MNCKQLSNLTKPEVCFFLQKGDKVNKYSLNDNEEELTHYGQSLSEIEKFDNPDISDEDDEDQGRIDGKFLFTGTCNS